MGFHFLCSLSLMACGCAGQDNGAQETQISSSSASSATRIETSGMTSEPTLPDEIRCKNPQVFSQQLECPGKAWRNKLQFSPGCYQPCSPKDIGVCPTGTVCQRTLSTMPFDSPNGSSNATKSSELSSCESENSICLPVVAGERCQGLLRSFRHTIRQPLDQKYEYGLRSSHSGREDIFILEFKDDGTFNARIRDTFNGGRFSCNDGTIYLDQPSFASSFFPRMEDFIANFDSARGTVTWGSIVYE